MRGRKTAVVLDLRVLNSCISRLLDSPTSSCKTGLVRKLEGAMNDKATGRREFLRHATVMGSIAMMGGLSQETRAYEGHPARIIEDAVLPGQEQLPRFHIKFAVCGMSHDHIYGMIGAVQRGGGELVAVWGQEPDKLAASPSAFPTPSWRRSQDEILNDPSIQLVLSSQIASERAPLGIKVMKHGKDFLSDKPGITTLEQLADVRKTIAETKRIYAIMYSRTAGGKGGGLCRETGTAGRHRQGHSNHQYRSAPGYAGARRCRRRHRPARLVLESRAVWRHPVRHRIAPGRSVPLTTPARPAPKWWSRRSPTCAIPIIRVSRTSATWCCAAIGLRLRATGLVHSGWAWNLGRWAALHPGNRWLYRGAQIHRRRSQEAGQQSVHRGQ